MLAGIANNAVFCLFYFLYPFSPLSPPLPLLQKSNQFPYGAERSKVVVLHQKPNFKDSNMQLKMHSL